MNLLNLFIKERNFGNVHTPTLHYFLELFYFTLHLRLSKQHYFMCYKEDITEIFMFLVPEDNLFRKEKKYMRIECILLNNNNCHRHYHRKKHTVK